MQIEEIKTVSLEKRKYLKRKTVLKFSANRQAPLPTKERKAYSPSKFTVQGQMTAKILTLKIGEMFTMSFSSDPSEISSRLTTFRKRFPDIKITTRKIEDNVIGVWRI
jgi:hypothetical protein